MLKPAYGEKSFNSHSQDSVQGASQSDLQHFVFMFFLFLSKIYNSMICHTPYGQFVGHRECGVKQASQMLYYDHQTNA